MTSIDKSWVSVFNSMFLTITTSKKRAHACARTHTHTHTHTHHTERQRRRQREKQASCREHDVGLDLGSPGSRPGLEADAQPLSHLGVPEV